MLPATGLESFSSSRKDVEFALLSSRDQSDEHWHPTCPVATDTMRRLHVLRLELSDLRE
jgi:hypothetical protein